MIVPLRQWIARQRHELANYNDVPDQIDPKRNCILQLTAVAFGLAHFLERVNENNMVPHVEDLNTIFSLDNFLVRLPCPNDYPQGQYTALFGIVGIDATFPRSSARFKLLSCPNDIVSQTGAPGPTKQNIEVEINSFTQFRQGRRVDGKRYAYLSGVLLYELFANKHPFITVGFEDVRMCQETNSVTDERPARKRHSTQSAFNGIASQRRISLPPASNSSVSGDQGIGDGSPFTPLSELGFPPSISTLVENLIGSEREGFSDCPYACLKECCEDLRLMILRPDRFLFQSLMSTGSSSSGTKLPFNEKKLYGREWEISLIMNAFRRVFLGASEAIVIGGVSGVGKTKLVETVARQVIAEGGFVVSGKIDLMEQEPYSAVIAAFNTLCVIIKNTLGPQEAEKLVVNIMNEFYSDFILLAQLLPQIYVLIPQIKRVHSSIHINLNGIVFLLRRLIRVISTVSRPVMLFLDDLHWSDKTSLGLIQAILSDKDGSRFFFVGSYWENGVDADHAIFTMINSLNSSGVQTTSLRLEGLDRSQLNSMVSDVLCTFPRMSQPLSDLVYKNTQGNPFFVREFMQSLVRRNLLQYSPRHKKWVWDASRIDSIDMTEDVMSLLCSKLSRLSHDIQTALKTMACFGVAVSSTALQLLSATPQHPNLLPCLDQAVEEGFIATDGFEFKFVHDKLQEAAYSNIPKEERDSFHFQLGLRLYSVTEKTKLNSMIFLICDQLKRAPDNLYCNQAMPMDAVALFVEAGSKAQEKSEYPKARSYLSTAEKLLPNDHWRSKYQLCLQASIMLAKSSYSCGFVDEALSALDKILENGQSLEDKLDAYDLMISILSSRSQEEKAFTMCCEVVSELYQPVPDAVNPLEVLNIVKEMSTRLVGMPEEEFLKLKKADAKTQSILKFLDHLVVLSFMAKPKITPYYICKIVQLSMKDGVSEFSAVGFAKFASMLCNNPSLYNLPVAKKIGTLSMAFQKRYDMTDHMPNLTAVYYGFVAPNIDPLQACADMHSRAFDVGMSLGRPNDAFYNPVSYLNAAFYSGKNLPKLLKKTKYYSKLATEFGQTRMKVFFEQYRETICILIGKTETSSLNGESKPTLMQAKMDNAHEIIRSFWLGHHARSDHLLKRFSDNKGIAVNMLHHHMLMFLHGLNAFQKKKGKSTDAKVNAGNEALKEMKQMAEYSRWNYRNKCLLLEAELLSTTRNPVKAEKLYAAAIEASNKSKFIHEEGLACELAGLHFLEYRKYKEALSHFILAKDCYTAWGSELKVESVTKKINELKK